LLILEFNIGDRIKISFNFEFDNGMRKSDKNKHKGEKNRFTATKSNRNLDNVRRVL
jgi:hypothetical protein